MRLNRELNDNSSQATPGVASQFAQDVRARMDELGMTQQELAEKLGVTRPTVAAILAARYSPNLTTVERVAKALDCVPTLKLSSR